MKQKIVLITNTFPFSPGEEFLETELDYWAQKNNIEFIIMPKNRTKTLRKVPNNILINDSFYKKQHLNKNNLKSLFKILMTSIFYKEIVSNNIFNLKKLKHTIIACRDFLFYKRILKKFIKEQNNTKILFYSFWHTEVCYALQSLKTEFEQIKIISRIHGFDLYKERRAYNYMPLKKHFINNIDKIYTISEKAKSYLIDTYNYNPDIVEVARLGVKNNNIITPSNKVEIFQITSCSYISDVKCIDKIIDSLSILSSISPQIKFEWTHIGKGKLYKKVYQEAQDKLFSLPNVNFKFLGHLKNSDIYKFYKENNIDVFINVSSSEGVPVTIMEAMSCHIPIVAPDIGGISEMIENNINGFLLSPHCKTSEIIDKLKNVNFFKNTQVRKNSYNIYLQKYNAHKNYNLFCEKVLEV